MLRKLFTTSMIVILTLLLFVPISANLSLIEDAEAAAATAMVSMVNNLRASTGAQAVSWNAQLAQAANNHNNDMAAGNFLDHTGSNGSNPGTRITATGYSWSTYGENILYQFADNDTTAYNTWFNSSGHYANMVNGAFCEIGIDKVLAFNGRWYYTMVLAAPRSGCSGTGGGGTGGGGTGGGGTGGGGTGGGTGGGPGGGGVLGMSTSGLDNCALFDGRLNRVCEEPWQTAAVYCRADGAIDVYGITNGEGWLAFRATQAEVDSLGIPNQNGLIDRSADGKIRLYRLTTGEFQVNAPLWDTVKGYLPNGYVFRWNGCE